MLYFTSLGLFWNYQFVLLNPFPLFTHPPKAPPIWQPSKCSLYLWICFCSACLFILFFRFNCWEIHIYCHFIQVFELSFLLEEDSNISYNTGLVEINSLAFSCLRSSLSVLWFWMIALLDIVIVFGGPCFSSRWILLVSLQSFHWDISWQSYGSSLVGN